MSNSHYYQECIYACYECVKSCQLCTAADLKEKHGMEACIRLNLECEAICRATATLMSLGSAQVLAISKLCAEICRKCEGECRKHDMDHCRECADACHRCAVLCTAL